MAVFTEVTPAQAQQIANHLGLGAVSQLRGIEGGIENTNYFLSTQNDQAAESHYVLTLFERLQAEQLPFYLYLMKHLAQAGIPVPDPQANAYGDILLSVGGKPATVVNKLSGKSQLQPENRHCEAVGDMLARMHLAGQDYGREQPNLRGLAWWNDTVPLVMPFLDENQSALIQTELAWQNHLAASPEAKALPMGPVHAKITLTGRVARVAIWAEDGQTLARLSEQQDELFNALLGDDLVGQVAILPGAPAAAAPAPAPGRFMDKAV